jgi:hypothetical protein
LQTYGKLGGAINDTLTASIYLTCRKLEISTEIQPKHSIKWLPTARVLFHSAFLNSSLVLLLITMHNYQFGTETIIMSEDQISQSYVIKVHASGERTTLMIVILLGAFSNIFETMRFYLIGISMITLLSSVCKGYCISNN